MQQVELPGAQRDGLPVANQPPMLHVEFERAEPVGARQSGCWHGGILQATQTG